MTNRLNVGLLLATLLAALMTTGAIIGRANAFDPGGPPPRGQAPTVVTGNWEMINYQPTGGSYSPQNEINKDNVRFLELKWLFPYVSFQNQWRGSGNYQVGSRSPITIVDGVAYVVKETRQIHAIDAKTGRQVWFSNGSSQVDGNALSAKYPYIQGYSAHVHALNYYRDKGWLMMNTPSCGPLMAWDIKTGMQVWEIGPEMLCGTNAEFGDPALAAAQPGRGIGSLGNQGVMPAGSNHPPSFVDNIMVWPVMGASGRGGRASIVGIDMSNPQNPQRLWRTWIMPPAQGDPNWAIDQCNIVGNGNGWYFSYPDYLASGKLAINCRDVPQDAVRNDWINVNPGTPHFGKIHTASSIAPVWGNMPADLETGLVYFGTGDIGPYPNGSYRFGPNLHGSAIIALEARTGKLAWWFSAVPHDLWDMDCAWGGILGSAAGTKVLIKSCKNGIVYALNAATGEPVWIFDPPSLQTARRSRGWWYGMDSNGDPNSKNACCRITKEDMGKPWMNCTAWDPSTMRCTDTSGASQQILIGPDAWSYIESDIAYDGKRVYAGVHNTPRDIRIRNMQDFGNQGTTIRLHDQKNTTLWAIDAATGQPVWSFFIADASFRGGLMVTGGVVYAFTGEGTIWMVDADTGELIHKILTGVGVMVMPTIGADSDGKHKIFVNIGGGGRVLAGAPGRGAEGSLAAYGLPDVLPDVAVREVVREVQVPGPERVVEVPGPERVVEVPGPERRVEVPVETISPLSYVAIGIGVVLVVVAGVLFTRRRTT